MNILESIVDMCIIESHPIYDAVLEGMANIFTEADFGYHGTLGNDVSPIAVTRYMESHPECRSRDEAIARIRAKRDSFNERHLGHKSRLPKGNMDDFLDAQKFTKVGKVVQVPFGHGGKFGKVVAEKNVPGEGMYLEVDVIAANGTVSHIEIPERDTMPASYLDEQRTLRKFAASQPANPNGYHEFDHVRIVGGELDQLDGKFIRTSSENPSNAIIRMSIFGNDRDITIPFANLVNEDKESRSASFTSKTTSTSAPPGARVLKTTFPFKR